MRIRLKYVDASALLRLLVLEPGPSVRLTEGDRVVSSHLVEVEAYRAVDRERLLGHLDDAQTATKRHVATAEILASEAEGEQLEFWTHDERQATAALSRGLTVRGT